MGRVAIITGAMVGFAVMLAVWYSLGIGMAVSITYLLASSALLTRLYPEPT